MRIAQVSPLCESVPPKTYGGTERVVSYLTEELCRRGHEVTLYASGDSLTRARLVPGCRRSLRLNPDCQNPLTPHVLQLEQVVRDADRYDVIHWHVEPIHYSLARRLEVPSVTTMHGCLDHADLLELFAEFAEAPLISISDAQRRPLATANWAATIHHGLPRDRYWLGDGAGGYLAFLGRISPEKRVDRAIRIARASGWPLKIAAKVDNVDREYFATRIEPLLAPAHGESSVELIGEIGEADKPEFLGRARALLFPIDWAEPFGLVMIEAMACGTPVIAYRHGSVPEVIEDGVSGFIVEDEAGAVAAVERLDELDRARCRQRFEARFTVERMVDEHLAIYAALAGRRKATKPTNAAPRPAVARKAAPL